MRRIAIGVFLLYLLAVVWPGAALFRSPEPFVLGLPLSMAWPTVWIVIGWITLLVLERFENRDEGD